VSKCHSLIDETNVTLQHEQQIKCDRKVRVHQNKQHDVVISWSVGRERDKETVRLSRKENRKRRIAFRWRWVKSYSDISGNEFTAMTILSNFSIGVPSLLFPAIRKKRQKAASSMPMSIRENLYAGWEVNAECQQRIFMMR
jgi:hypothetical protein